MELPEKDVEVVYQMGGLPPKKPKPLTEKEQQKLERMAKKSGRRTQRRMVTGDQFERKTKKR